MPTRGTSKFEIEANGHVKFNDSNLEILRKIFLDRSLIKDKELGPGDPGDFDLGAWHVLCHLVGGTAVYRNSGTYLWIEISHVPLLDIYTATVTVDVNKEPVSTFPLLSPEGQALLQKAELIGFVEGSSLGHISARDSKDIVGKFNQYTRQEFDVDEKSEKEGGRVWEHWCTLRDITPNAVIGLSVLKAYLSMVSFCGGRFASIVARGRITKDYNHAGQLVALVKYGFISSEDALIDITPKPLPKKIENLIYSADPGICVNAVKTLPWDEHNLTYFMFERKIKDWNPANKVKTDLSKAKLL